MSDQLRIVSIDITHLVRAALETPESGATQHPDPPAASPLVRPQNGSG